MPGLADRDSLEYTRRLYSSVLEWYKSADTKAQVLLAIDGAFLAFITGSIFRAPGNLETISGKFGDETWFFLILMCACLFSSIISALYCIWSRLYSSKSLTRLFERLEIDPSNSESWTPEVVWFFQMITRLEPEEFIKKLMQVDRDFEIRALAHEIVTLSKNVNKKHTAVDVGFILAAVTLGFFLSAAVSYLIRTV